MIITAVRNGALTAGLIVGLGPGAAVGAALGAQPVDDGRVVITNVRLTGPAAPSEDVPVNLLIVGGELVVVTRDELVVQEGDVAVDASDGFLVGQLVLGGRPSFVILDGDPRVQFEVLLDTQAHVRFAVQEGSIVRNELPAAAASPPGAEPRRRGWGTYTPPPIAVPIRYFDSRKWNRFSTGPISGLFLGAVMLDRQFWLHQDDNSESQVRDLAEYEKGKIRGFRLGVVGTLNFKRPWRYTVFAATNVFDSGFDVRTTDEFQMVDYRLDIPLPAGLTFSIGKLRQAMSMERLTGMTFLPMQERAAPNDAFLPARTHGVVLSGNGGDRFTWAVGAFNNWIDGTESFSNTTTAYTGRATWVAAASEDDSNLLHLGLGLRFVDATQPLRFGSRPEFNSAPRFVDTGEIASDGAWTYNLETYWRPGPFLVGLEYFGVDVASAEKGDPFFSGYSVTGSWAVTGEMRAYRRRNGSFDPLPVSRPVNQGGWGSLEAAVRYSRLDLNEGTVEGGDMKILSLGLNWWLARGVETSVNYRLISLDRFGMRGTSSGLVVRLLLMLD